MNANGEKKDDRSHRTEIIVALITLVGVLGGALLTNWERVFPRGKIDSASFHIDSSSLPKPSSTDPQSSELFAEKPPTSNEREDQNIIGRSDESECRTLALKLSAPVEIEKGDCFSNVTNTQKSSIKLVTRNAIIFVNYKGKEITCSIGDACSFGWQGAPIFHLVSSAYPKEKVYIVGEN